MAVGPVAAASESLSAQFEIDHVRAL